MILCSTVDGGLASLRVVSQLLREKAYAELVDFDCHLDDVSLDWLNPSVNSLIDLRSRKFREGNCDAPFDA